MKRTFSLWLLTGLVITAAAQGPDYKPFPEWQWGIEDSTEYYLYTPTQLEPGQRYPIALFMHGCCGDDLHASARNAVDPPARMWHNFGANEQEIPTYIISAATNRGWSKHFSSLKKVIDFLVEKRQGDPTRIYVSGFSMGGRGTFEFISAYPDLFAAALPMGMSFFNGDFAKVKDIPIWANQGAEDWWARELPKFIRETRALNGLPLDSAFETVTGVNPRYTSFEGVGHGVQWHAASTQDLTSWAYSKVNDGNKYPYVYVETPTYRQEVPAYQPVAVSIQAYDPDGSIAQVEVFLNHQLAATLMEPPFETRLQPAPGDNLLEARAVDNQGKYSTATALFAVDIEPELSSETLPYARVGARYAYWLPVRGNGALTFTASELPGGLSLLPDGLLRGLPTQAGTFSVPITLEDGDGDRVQATLRLEIKAARDGEVQVTHAHDVNQHALPVAKMVYNEEPNFQPQHVPTSFVGEINFSELNRYYGLTFLQTDHNDSTPATENYLSFAVDQPVRVLVGYEKFDRLRQPTLPAWLNEFTPEKEEVVAQFRYFGVYSEAFPAGTITLPGGDKKGNGRAFNYFVMVQPTKPVSSAPEINLEQLPPAKAQRYYQAQLTALYGFGNLRWEIREGALPAGLQLSPAGQIRGVPAAAGEVAVTVQAMDEKGQVVAGKVRLEVR